VRFLVARTDFRRGRDGPRGGDRESEIGGESETERERIRDGGPAPEEQVRLWVVDRWLEVRFSVARTDFRRGWDSPRGGDQESEIGGESETERERDAVGERDALQTEQ
jgi:hypothetical protein